MNARLLALVSLVTLLAAPAAAQASEPAQTCKVYDSRGNEIYSGPCNSYADSCLAYAPPNCPTVRCSGGTIGNMKNGSKCLPGTARQYQGEQLIETIDICYCDVPAGPLANPLSWLVGLALGFGVFRRRLI